MKFSFIDGSVWIIAFLATIVLNTEIGLAVAVLYLLLTLAIRSNQESVSELNQEGIDIFFFPAQIYFVFRASSSWLRAR